MGRGHGSYPAGEAIGIVGPLVIPGRSACLHCLDLARAERDPAWPQVLAQIIGRQPSTPACDCVLATSVAAQACAQVLMFVDRGRADTVTNGSLELVAARLAVAPAQLETAGSVWLQQCAPVADNVDRE